MVMLQKMLNFIKQRPIHSKMFKRLCSFGFLRGLIQIKKGSLREIYQKMISSLGSLDSSHDHSILPSP